MKQPSNSIDRKALFADQPLALILVAVVVLTVFFYQARVDTIAVSHTSGDFTEMTGPVVNFLSHNLAALLLMGLLPLVSGHLLCGLRLQEVGLGVGQWSRGLVWLAVGIPLACVVAWFSAAQPEMQAVYPLERGLTSDGSSFIPHLAGQLVYYIAWEVLFRGVLLFGLRKRMGFAGANIVQTALSAIAHFGKPLPEALAAIPAGLIFGGIAKHTRSVWYVVLIHLAVGAAQDWFIVR